MKPLVSFSLFLVIFCSVVAASTQKHPWIDCSPKLLDSDIISGPVALVNSDATIDKDNIEALLSRTLANLSLLDSEKINDKDMLKYSTSDYVVLHVLRWKDLAPNATGQEAEQQHWYVYHKGKWSEEDFSKNNRLFGVDRVWLMYIHLNKDESFHYESKYDTVITSKLPTYLSNLFLLAGAYTSLAAKKEIPHPSKKDFWNARRFKIDYTTSDITITPTFEVMKDAECDASAGTQTKNITPAYFDNEGKSFIDFSVAVPINKISQLTFNDSNNSISPQKIDTTNAFALLNVYIPKADIKNTTFTWVPHFIAGIAYAKQPLHKILLGAGWGPYYAQFYLGALLVIDAAPSGTTCGTLPSAVHTGTALNKRVCTQFSFGLNVPVGGLVQALKK